MVKKNPDSDTLLDATVIVCELNKNCTSQIVHGCTSGDTLFNLLQMTAGGNMSESPAAHPYMLTRLTS